MAVSSSAPLALLIIVALTIVLTNVRVKTEGAHERDHGSSEYCIVGGGPGGLQVALEMDYEAMDYAVFEREPRAGSFFEVRLDFRITRFSAAYDDDRGGMGSLTEILEYRLRLVMTYSLQKNVLRARK